MKGERVRLTRQSPKPSWAGMAVVFLALFFAQRTGAQQADLVVTQTVSANPIAAGANVSFHIRVTNSGPDTATSVVLSNFLSAKSTFISASPSQGDCTAVGGIIRCSLGNLDFGEEASVDLLVRVAAGTNTNFAAVWSSEIDLIQANNTSLRSTVGTITLPEYVNGDAIVFEEILGGPGSIYPSDIVVSGLTSVVYKVTVILRTLSHSFPDDLDILLVGPSGTNVMLMSDCGLDNAITDVNITLDDGAAIPLPDSDPPGCTNCPIVSGTYRPSNYGSVDVLPSPAPSRPFGNNLAVFIGTNPNGTWSLFANDDLPEQGGVMADGWSMTLLLGDPIADLEIKQSGSPGSLVVGSSLTYTITVTNHGPADSQAVIQDTLPAGMSVVSATPTRGSCTSAGGKVLCDLGNLLNGQGAGVTLVVIPSIGGQATNTITVGGNQLDLIPSNNSASVVTAITPAADLAVAGFASAEPTLLQQPVTWTFSVTNRGPSPASSVALSNVLPAGVTFVSTIASQGSCTNFSGRVICQLGAVAPGSAAQVAVVGRPGVLGPNTNVVTVSAAELDLVSSNNRAEVITTVRPAADLVLMPISVPASVPLGQLWSITLLASNQGPNTATALFSQMLPASVTFVSATTAHGSCSNAGANVFCQLGDLAPGDSATVVVVGQTAVLGALASPASVSGNIGDPVQSNNFITVSTTVVPATDLEVRIADSPDPVSIGDNLIYTLSLTNRGPVSATAVNLTNILPDSVVFVAATPSQGACIRKSSTISCALGTLASGASATVTVVGQPTGVGFVTNVASVLGSEPDPNLTNNVFAEITRVTPFDPNADVSVIQSFSANPVAVGTNLVITYNVTNFGPASTPNVLLTNAFDPSLTILSVVASQGSCTNTGGVLSCQLGTLNRATGATVSITAVVPAIASFTNTVAVTASQPDPNLSNNVSAVLLEAEAPPVITLNPVTLTVTNGVEATFFAAATGSPPLSFQWQRNGVNLPGATNTTLLLPGASPTNAGSYRFRAQNRVGIAFSDVAMLHVLGPPTISDIADVTIDENTATDPILFMVSDSETPAEAIVVTGNSSDPVLMPQANISFGGSGSNRTVRLTPAPDHFGIATISVTAQDSDGDMTTTFFQLTVRRVNQPPSISDIANGSTAEDTPLVVNFVAGDLETPLESLVFTAASSNPVLIPQDGIAFAGTGSNRTATLTPARDQFGTVIITITVSDSEGASASDSFRVTVVSVNDPPTLDPISDLTVPEDSGPQKVALTGITSGATNEFQNLLVTASSSNPAVVPDPVIVYTNGDSFGMLTFAPLTNASGSAVITVTVRDGQATNGTFSRSFTVNVTPVNDSPTISELPPTTIDEDTTISLPLAVSDPDDSVADLVLTAVSSNPVIVPNTNIIFGGSGANRTVTLMPALNQFGTLHIFITATDPGGATNTINVPLTINPVNDPPTLNAITNLDLPRNAGLQTVPLSGIGSGASNEVDPLLVTATSSNPSLIPNLTVNYTSPNPTGTLRFTPATNASGAATITVTVNDQQARSNLTTRSFTVNVGLSSEIPTISNIADQTTNEDTPLAIPFIISDGSTPAALIGLSGNSSNPTLVAASNIVFSGSGSNRTVTVTPSRDQSGTTTITVTATSSSGSASDSFVLTVNAVNDPPTLAPIPNFVTNAANGNPRFSIPISGITSGAANENQTLTVTVTSSDPNFLNNSAVTYISPDANGTITLRPGNSVTGSAVLTVTVTDNGTPSQSFSRSFRASVKSSANVLPTISGITNVTLTEDTASGPLPFTVRDAETPASSLTLLVASSNPALLPTNNIVLGGTGTNRTITLIPVTNQFGSADVTLTVIDGGFGLSNRTFTVTVNPVNDAPTISSIANQSTAEDTPTAPITFTIGDVETAAGGLLVTATSSNTTLVPTAGIALGGSGPNRALVITPATNQSGTATITVRVSDGIATNSTSFTLTVTAVNDPPTLSSLPNQTVVSGTAPAPVPFTVRDAETVADSLTLAGTSSNPVLVPNINIIFAGSGTNRTIAVTPEPGQTGTATITVTVTDASNASASASFLLTVNPTNHPPTLDPIPDVLVNESAGPQTITLTGIGPGAGDSNQVVALSASTLDTNLIAQLAINYVSPSNSAMLSFLAVPSLTGTGTVTVTVNDGQPQNNLTTLSFTVTINSSPTISPLLDITTFEDTPTPTLLFTVADTETPASNLVVTAVSSNPALIPNANLVLDGIDADRSLAITPATNQSGFALITLTVIDTNGASRSSSFYVTVLALLDPIIITAQPQHQAAQQGDSATFSVTAASTLQPLAYQWQHNGAAVFGATNSTLTLTNVQAADVGLYAVQVSNADGTATSALARLKVLIEPTIVLITQTGTTARISFTTVEGANYTVEFKDNLADPAWTPLQMVAGTGAVLNVVDPSATSPTRFYRIRAQLRILVEPTISLITRAGTTANISFTTVEGLNYTVEFKNSLTDPAWTPLETMPGTGAVLTTADASATVPTRFYRVRVE